MNALRLTPRFEVEPLLADLAQARAQRWNEEQNYFEATPWHSGWKGISLVSQGGRVNETSPGGPGLVPFVPTPALERAPALRRVLDAIPGAKQSVRLLALAPGGTVPEHDDVAISFEHGLIRLHVPLVTHPDVRFVIGGERVTMRPGELWYGDFSLPHAIWNESAIERVHLVIDTVLTPALLDCVAEEQRPGDAFFGEPEVPLDVAALTPLQCRFGGPAALARLLPMSWAGGQRFDGELAVDGERLVMAVNGRAAIALVPIGPSRFRLLGAPPCVTLEATPGRLGRVASLVLHARLHKKWLHLPLPLQAAAPARAATRSADPEGATT